MPNPQGHNQWGEKECPEPELLKSTLIKYARQNLSRVDKLDRLRRDLSYDIGKTKLNELEREYGIPSVRRPGKTTEEINKMVVGEIKKDTNMQRGPVALKSLLRDQGTMVPRSTVRSLMHKLAPHGFHLRYPGSQKVKNPRVALWAFGPYHEISADGHEKLNSQALQMGEISLAIYLYRDKWSGAILKLSVLPDCRTAAALGHVFLDLVADLGGIPMQMTTDKGPEVGWQYALQDGLRALYAPQIKPEIYPSFVTLKSVHNTVSESTWRFLGEQKTRTLKEVILRGKADHIFRPQCSFHCDLFYWVFVPLVQKELDEFKSYWNNHKIRRQAEKRMPSEHVPLDALEHPEVYDGINCLIKIPKDGQDVAREYLTGKVSSQVTPPESAEKRVAKSGQLARVKAT
ncbi:hypothetical protein D9611_007779 [Ephemerocybe angulata]|uniref:Integrase core domain-containing protein n=1 Tax=Ephemerocybe angulata TaxID=980116 RepID=A0A8H5CEH8_9AGAR|nr:hypothetical protein D9611_007779 [Tulosesus angulatus]